MKTLAVNLAVLALAGALAVGALEAWLRLTIPASSGGSIYEHTTDTPRYKRMKPNASIIAWGKELRTNDLGFRDDAPSIPAKAPGELRVIVLGDSFTVSAGVAYEAIFTSMVQRELAGDFSQLRVINLAVGGYNVVQYELVLAEVGLALEPDLLVVALYPENDFSMDTYEQNLRAATGQAPALRRLPWHQRTYVYEAHGQRIESRLRRMLGSAPAAAPAASPGGWDENWRALESIARTARERALTLEVLLLPSTWNMTRQRELHGRIQARCGALGISCFDLLEPFIESGVRESRLRLNALDAHPNERYNAMVAERLAPRLAPALRRVQAEPRRLPPEASAH